MTIPEAYTTPEGVELVDKIAARMHSEWGIVPNADERQSARDTVLDVLSALDEVAGATVVTKDELKRLQFADRELTKLEDWISDSLPHAVPADPTVTTVDFAITLLDTCRAVFPMVAKVIVQQIWTPLVAQFRAVGFDMPEVEVKHGE